MSSSASSQPLSRLIYRFTKTDPADSIGVRSGSCSLPLRILVLFCLLHLCVVPTKPNFEDSIAKGPSPSKKLTSEGVTRGEISGNTAVAYHADLLANQYLHLVIAKNDLRLSATIYAPGDKKFAEFTSDRFGACHVAVVAEQAGRYRLEIRSNEESSHRSTYDISVQKWRIATPTDRKYVSALQHYEEAEAARRGWSEKLLKDAIYRYSAAAAGWAAIKRNAEAGDALTQAGDLYFMLSNYNSALDSYTKAAERFTIAGDSLGGMSAQNRIGYALVYLGKNDKASRHIQNVLEYCSSNRTNKLPDTERLQAQALNSMGEIYYAKNDLPKALDFFQRALNLWIAISDRRGSALAQLNIGYSYYDLGDIDEASKYYEEALRLYEKVDDRRGQALSRTALGGVHSFLGEKQRALEFHSRAMELFQAIGDREGEAAALNGIGKAYEDLNDHETALLKYRRALQRYREVGNRNFEALSSYYVGRSYRLMNDIPNAVGNYNRCVTLSRQIGALRFEAYALKDLGIIDNALGQRERALERFNHVLTIYKGTEDRRGQAHALNSIGYVYWQLGKGGEAVNYFNQALSISQIAKDRQAELSVLYNLARAKRDEGELDQALALTNDSIAIIELLRNKIISRDLRASYFASLHQHYELKIDLLMMLWKRTAKQSFLEAAVEASEQSRARSLLEVLNEVKTSGRYDIAPALLERKLHLEKSLDAKGEYQMRLLNGKHSAESAANLSREIHSLAVEYDSVQSEIKSQSPHYALLTQPQLLQFSDIQSEVKDDNTLLLEYSLGEERSYLWAVSRSAVTAYELPDRATIEAACRKFYELLTSRQPKANESSSDYEQRVIESDKNFCWASRTLGQMLLGPIANELGEKRLLVSGDGALHYIPFDALTISANCDKRGPEAAADWVPLMLHHQIVELPSISVLAALRDQKHRQTERTILVFADPIFEANDPRLNKSSHEQADPVVGPELDHAMRDANDSGNEFRISRLPGTRREGEAILSLTPAGEGVMVTGLEADRATAMSPQIAQYRILHFATHGIVNSENPQLSGLILSRVDKNGSSLNGFLRLPDIYNLKLNADLVVLSACRTRLGKDVTGEGLVGLTQGFMYAGSKGVVGSLWKVDDEATAELMVSFYTAMLKDGLTPAAALQASKIKMWKQKCWQSPFFWSAFVLQGEYERPTTAVISRRLIYWVTATVLALLLGAGGYFYLRLIRRRIVTR